MIKIYLLIHELSEVVPGTCACTRILTCIHTIVLTQSGVLIRQKSQVSDEFQSRVLVQAR